MFKPFEGYVEVERLSMESPLASDEKTYDEKGKVIKTNTTDFEVGDIIFFRPHGFFELAEHNGEKHYVVRVSPEFILGIYKNVAEK
jgi:hypothetical protein